MASTVAAPLERHLGQIPGIDSMSSRSSEGSASVIMIFQTGRKVDSAARDVQAAINAAAPDLPSGLTNAPTYRKANPNAQPVRRARADQRDAAALEALRPRRFAARAAHPPARRRRRRRSRRRRDAGDPRRSEPARAERDGPVARSAAQRARGRERDLAAGLPLRRPHGDGGVGERLAAHGRRVRRCRDLGEERRAGAPERRRARLRRPAGSIPGGLVRHAARDPDVRAQAGRRERDRDRRQRSRTTCR